jgi:hypothetical protein
MTGKIRVRSEEMFASSALADCSNRSTPRILFYTCALESYEAAKGEQETGEILVFPASPLAFLDKSWMHLFFIMRRVC